MDKNISYDRYQRQIILKGFGDEAQQKLFRAKVLVIGAGGLGCPALQYLVGAGIGTVGIIDDDVVSISNLHRQVIYSVNDVGSSKALRAAIILKQLNPDIAVVPYNERLSTYNAIDIIKSYDLVVDGSDNFATRYLVNDACVLLNKPFVYGAVSQYEGQLAMLNLNQEANEKPVNYRDMFPQPPKDGEILNCEQAGVLGVLPGIIGVMMATEAIKYFTGIGSTLANRFLTYNALNNQCYDMELIARDETYSLIPADEKAFRQMDYDLFCSSPMNSFEISYETFKELLENNTMDVIDIREHYETPAITEFKHLSIPSAGLKNDIGKLKSDTIVLICQSGKRSLQAAKELSEIIGSQKKIYCLHGGIISWKQHVKMN